MRRALCALALLLLLLAPLPARGETLQEGLDNVLAGLPLEGLQEAVDALTGAAGRLDVRETILSLARGETRWDAAALLEHLCDYFLGALRGSIWRFSRLMAPAILCGIVSQLRGAFARDHVAEIAHFACFLLVAVFMVKDLGEHMALAQQAIGRMSDAMQTLFPLLLTLLAAVGGTASTAFFQPAIVAASGTMTAVIRNVTMRFATGAAVLTVLDHLSDHLHVSRMASLMRSVANWTLGVSFTVFISVTALQGMGAAAVDGVSIRTAKYAIDNFVPIVGGMFADTVDTLVGCSLLIKNALGVTGLVLLVASAGAPMVQTLAGVLVYRVSAALLEPVAESRIVRCIHDFSGVLMLLFIIQLSIGAMFLLLVAQLLVVGNLTVMLR